jgi:hypothetical protein
LAAMDHFYLGMIIAALVILIGGVATLVTYLG